jgi:hypothetical protein
MHSTPPAADLPVRRWRFGQFSLVSLLLLAVIGCLVGAYLGERRKLHRADTTIAEKDAQIRQYRIDLGILDEEPNVLTIGDPNLIHVRQLPSFDRWQWRWRIYLPPGKRWKLMKTQGETWDDERHEFRGSGSGSTVDDSGEVTLTAQITRDLDGKAQLRLRWFRRGSGTWIPDGGLTLLQSQGKAKRTIHTAGSKAQEIIPAGGRLELLRYHVELADDAPLPGDTTLPGHRDPSRSYGISIALEEVSTSDPLLKMNRGSRQNR